MVKRLSRKIKPTSQGLIFLLDVIAANEERNESYFIIVGSGTEYGKIKSWFEANHPDNSMLLSSLPKKEFDDLVKACDVGLIFLDKRFTIPNYPSRLLSYLENRMPVLLATDQDFILPYSVPLPTMMK